MNSSYDDLLPHRDNYALTILTQAAMQRNCNNTNNPPSNNSDSLSNPNGSNFPINNNTGNNSNHNNNNIHASGNSGVSTSRDANYLPRGTPITTSISSSTITNHPSDISQYSLQPSLPNLVEAYTASHPAMETLVFNPTDQLPQSAYMNHSFQPRYSSSLGILNAEKYDDGRASLGSQSHNMMSTKNQMSDQIPFGILERNGNSSDTGPPSEEQEQGGKKRRKRVRNESPSLEDDDEDARKKARGRPRVDTKDETAADRRRTQIRLAQRAYRHRKETTISSLEKQVQELRGTNEEMNNIFLSLYDFAISRGLLQREPEFGQQLQSTTERFLALAKQTASDDNLRDDVESPDNTAHESHIETKYTSNRRNTQRSSPPVSLPEEPTVTETTHPWSGYIVSKETSDEEERQTGYNQQGARDPKNFEVISRATEDNASFPFDFMNLQQYRVEIPSPTIDDFSQFLFPEAQVPLPNTHSYFELSFARRMHRAAVEVGYQLLTSPNIPKDKFQKVFGYCLKYETMENVAFRLQRVLNSSTKDTLQNWRAPFVHLGGAGTYYPNQGPDTDNEFMPKFRTGFSMGPFPAALTPVWENISSDMKCTIPGFEGDFFDPNDVEGYLRGHGFDPYPAADYITGQIDLEALVKADGSETDSTDSRFPLTPRSPTAKASDDTNQGAYDFDHNNGDLSKGVQNDSTSSLMKFLSWDANPFKGTNPFDLSGPIFDGTAGPNSENACPTATPKNKKRTVTIKVDTLIKELAVHASCLGRTPGFRRADVNAAIIAAAKEAGFE